MSLMSSHETAVVGRFCNQFLLGPDFVDSLEGWQQIAVAPIVKITAHPDLEITQISEAEKSLTLIGYILDPRSPAQNNSSIVKSLLDQFSTSEQLFAATSGLGGRWAIVARNGDDVFLFNDALGLRQVFYCDTKFTEDLWVMSQPGLYPDFEKLKVDDKARKYMDSHEVRICAEYRWPGSACAFREIQHLLPNHSLNLGSGVVQRYWPNKNLGSLSIAEGVSKAVGLLQGLMAAADNRFDLVLGMTAGYDSRIALAASKQFYKNLSAITVRQGTMPDDHQDIEVSKKLLEKYEIKHETIKAMPYMSASFSKLYKENVFMAHDHYGPDAEAILNHFHKKKVVVTGSGAEVARNAFQLKIDPDKSDFTPQDLARLQWMGDDELVVEAYQAWLDGLTDIKNVHLLDLFSWEQSHGNWLANTQLEFDIAWNDIFTPFNCRELLSTLLSVKGAYRGSPDYQVSKALIEEMWPELLTEPINPMEAAKPNRNKTLLRKVGSAVKSKLRKLG